LSHLRSVDLDLGEIMMARETTFALSEKGKVEERHVLSSPLANLRFALTLFAKAAGASYEFPAGDPNFEQLQRVQRVRNRLTHPRSSLELDVTADEQDMAIKAVEWVGQEHTKLLKTFAYRLHSGLASFRSGINSLPKTESGGYAATALEKLLVEGLTSSHPLTSHEVDEWFASFVEKR
jgi:hypothetical protein